MGTSGHPGVGFGQRGFGGGGSTRSVRPSARSELGRLHLGWSRPGAIGFSVSGFPLLDMPESEAYNGLARFR